MAIAELTYKQNPFFSIVCDSWYDLRFFSLSSWGAYSRLESRTQIVILVRLPRNNHNWFNYLELEAALTSLSLSLTVFLHDVHKSAHSERWNNSFFALDSTNHHTDDCMVIDEQPVYRDFKEIAPNFETRRDTLDADFGHLLCFLFSQTSLAAIVIAVLCILLLLPSFLSHFVYTNTQLKPDLSPDSHRSPRSPRETKLLLNFWALVQTTTTTTLARWSST